MIGVSSTSDQTDFFNVEGNFGFVQILELLGLSMICIDSIAILILVFAVTTGLRTMRRHRSFFQKFKAADLVSLRVDALLYVLLSVSTALCAADAFLRMLWIAEGGCAAVDSRWSILWIVLHSAFALTSTALHLLIARLLGNTEFCELCRREF